jgi:hypothetical protein
VITVINIATVIVLLYHRHKLADIINATTKNFVCIYIYIYIYIYMWRGGARAQGFGRNRYVINWIRITRYFCYSFNNIVPRKRESFTVLIKTYWKVVYQF